jgi:hypothetical protein
LAACQYAENGNEQRSALCSGPVERVDSGAIKAQLPGEILKDAVDDSERQVLHQQTMTLLLRLRRSAVIWTVALWAGHHRCRAQGLVRDGARKRSLALRRQCGGTLS